MKTRTYFYTVVAVLLLVACDKNGASGELAVHSGLGNTVHSQQQNQQQGLPGNGDQQASQDVTTSPEYQQFILPRGEKIASLNEFSLPDEEKISATNPSRIKDFFSRIAQSKKWGLIDLNVASANHQVGGGRVQLVPTQIPASADTQAMLQQQQQSSVATPPAGTLFQDKVIRITQTSIFLDLKAYKAGSADYRAQMILHALVVQMFLNQYDTATNLLNQMAAADPQIKNDKTLQEAQAEDQADSFQNIGTALTAGDAAGIQSFWTFLLQDPAQITADSLDAAVKAANFARGDRFARPYVYQHTTTPAASDATATAATSTTADQ
jgi:hypothetical protein